MPSTLAPHELHKIHSDGGVVPVPHAQMRDGATSERQNAVIAYQDSVNTQNKINSGILSKKC